MNDNLLNSKYENYIFPLFWYKGESKEDIEQYVEKIFQSNIYGFCIESRGYKEFNEKKWYDDVKIALNKAKCLGMRVIIVDDSHFPTGYANGAILKNQNLRKKVLKRDCISVVARNNDCYIKVDKGKKIIAAICEINGHKKELDIDGKRIKLLKYPKQYNVEVYYSTTEVDVHNEYIDMLQKESCDLMINEIYEKHYKELKEYFGNTIIGFFSDEPGFGSCLSNIYDAKVGKNIPIPYSEAIFDKLSEKYSPKELYSSLFTLEINKIKRDYMDLITDAYKTNFSDNIGNWCKSKGIEYLGHVIEDNNAHNKIGLGVGHFFKAVSGKSIGGIDIVLNQLRSDIIEDFNQVIPVLNNNSISLKEVTWDAKFFRYTLAKLGTSSSFIDLKKNNRTMCEIFGAFGWQLTMNEKLWLVNHMLSRGINVFVPHAFSMKRFPDDDCPPHFYAHGNNELYPFFGALMKYIQSLSKLSYTAKPVAKIAVVYDAELVWMGYDSKMNNICEKLTQNQIPFIIIPEDKLEEFDFDIHIYCNDEYFKNIKDEKGIEFSTLSTNICKLKQDYQTIIHTESKDIVFYNFQKEEDYCFVFNESNQYKASVSIINNKYKLIDIESNIEYANKNLILEPNQLIILRKSSNNVIQKIQWNKVEIKYNIRVDEENIEINLEEPYDNLFLQLENNYDAKYIETDNKKILSYAINEKIDISNSKNIKIKFVKTLEEKVDDIYSCYVQIDRVGQYDDIIFYKYNCN